MKLTCSQADLNTHLSVVNRAVPSRPSHPILANVRLAADEQTLSLTGFDLSLGIQTSFNAQVETPGRLTLPAKLLSDIVSRLPDGDITLTADENQMVTLTCSSGEYQVKGLPADEYPELPTMEESDVVYLPAAALGDGLKGTLFATSSDETKQLLTGVHVRTEQDGLEFAATDGHRLAVVQSVSEPADAADGDGDNVLATGDFDVTVPGKALRELERMLQMQPSSDSSSGAIAVRFDQGQLIVDWANQRLTSRLLEGQYPNYNQLIPKQFSRQVTIERKLLISALDRIAVLADQKNGIVKLSLDPAKSTVLLSVDAPDVGSGKESVAAQISGDALDIAFNVKYLQDGLKALSSSEVQMQCDTATSPAVISPLGGVKMTYLVMPVQIRS
ncbi:MAG: DNA polymerase III subunit beta [Leptolyngbyaceae bacterium]|nr:DNA polymerase III subunit beta [Leptolyngbyaceae bacterium]